MADEIDAEAVAALRKKRQFKKFTFRGLELKQLLDLSKDELINILNARARRKLQRGTKPKHSALLEKLKKAKTAAGPLEKPKTIKTHLRDMLIVPEMIGSMVAVYSGKVFNIVEIKAEMVGYYLGEFSITYHTVRHGRPSVGGGKDAKFMSLK